MTRLVKYSESMSEAIARQEIMLLDLQEKLSQLTQEIRVNQQVHKAQQTFEKELSSWLKQGEKLLKDSASLYPQDALQNIVEDVQEVVSKVAENYEELSKSSRFLSGEEEEPIQQNLEIEKLPEPIEIDGILTITGITQLVDSLDEGILLKLAQLANIRAKNKSNIIKHLVNMNLSQPDLMNMIETAKSLLRRALSGD